MQKLNLILPTAFIYIFGPIGVPGCFYFKSLHSFIEHLCQLPFPFFVLAGKKKETYVSTATLFEKGKPKTLLEQIISAQSGEL